MRNDSLQCTIKAHSACHGEGDSMSLSPPHCHCEGLFRNNLLSQVQFFIHLFINIKITFTSQI